MRYYLKQPSAFVVKCVRASREAARRLSKLSGQTVNYFGMKKHATAAQREANTLQSAQGKLVSSAGDATGGYNKVLLPVLNPEGKTLKVRVQLEHDDILIVLHELTGPSSRALTIQGCFPLGATMKSVNELQAIIDGLYSLGVAWQKQDTKQESHGDKQNPS